MRRAGIRRWIVRGLAVVLAPVLGFLAWSLASDNFGTVREGQVYRSGQMSAGAIERTVRARGIKTVVNLRGRTPRRRSIATSGRRCWRRGPRRSTSRCLRASGCRGRRRRRSWT